MLCKDIGWIAVEHAIHTASGRVLREERISTSCNNIDDLLSIADIDY